MGIFAFTIATVIVISAAELTFVREEDGGTQTLEIRDNQTTLLRTQFLPGEKQEGAERRSDGSKCDNFINGQVQIRNSTYEMRNGKMYKVTRVRKKIIKQPCYENIVAQRRHSQWDAKNQSLQNIENQFKKVLLGIAKNQSQLPKTSQSVVKNLSTGPFSVIPQFSSHQSSSNRTNARQSQGRNLGNTLYNIIPQLSSGQWQINNPENGQSNDNNVDRSWQFWTSSNPITSKTLSRKKEKIKKLLNLFTIVEFDNEGCFADGLKGTCYHQSECGEKGGRPIGPCARGFGVCCYIERTCGQITNENCTYFVNEGFPQTTTSGPGVCALTVNKAHPDVRQLRLEFETFELRGPVNGTCSLDRFLVTGQNRNSIVPNMCGVNTGQHVYVDVDARNGPFTMNMVTSGHEPGRKWRIKVTQLRPGNELLAPQNCLQYFTELSGVFESFNYQLNIHGNAGEASSGYFNNLNYDICIKKGESFCTVTYNTQPTLEAETDFQLINFDMDGEPVIPRGQAGAEVFNCPDDYITVNGVRLCGDRLNDATVELDYTKSAPVTDLSAGPAQLTVRTNQDSVSRGFRLHYKQNPCLE